MTGFMTRQRCLAFAERRATREGIVFHVVRTGDETAPLRVLDAFELFANADRLGPHDVIASAEPPDLAWTA